MLFFPNYTPAPQKFAPTPPLPPQKHAPPATTVRVETFGPTPPPPNPAPVTIPSHITRAGIHDNFKIKDMNLIAIGAQKP